MKDLEPAPPVRRCQSNAPVFSGCCCECKFHLQDFYHCSSTPRPLDASGALIPNCVCGIPKGWICMAPDTSRVHSGWTEHGLCETFQAREGLEYPDLATAGPPLAESNPPPVTSELPTPERKEA